MDYNYVNDPTKDQIDYDEQYDNACEWYDNFEDEFKS